MERLQACTLIRTGYLHAMGHLYGNWDKILAQLNQTEPSKILEMLHKLRFMVIKY